MRLKCSICEVIVSFDTVDSKATISVAKASGWKKTTTDWQAVCPDCVNKYGVKVNIESNVVNNKITESDQAIIQKCENCLHFTHEGYCSGFKVCDNLEN
jgi:hypothetical protein